MYSSRRKLRSRSPSTTSSLSPPSSLSSSSHHGDPSLETFVLIPEQLSLTLSSDSLSVVSNCPINRGFRFSPFQGTLRTDDKLSLALERGKSDKYYYWSGGFRAQSWVRFLRQSSVMGPEVNLMEVITTSGQIMYEVRKPLDVNDELVVYSPDSSPANLAKAIKEAIFEQAMRALMLEVPLDLSTSVFQKMVSKFLET